MIHFKRIGGKYLLKGNFLEIPTQEILKYPHNISDDDGVLLIDLYEGCDVLVYPSKVDREVKTNFKLKRIKEFVYFGGTLCARFYGSNIPHAIDCLELINLTNLIELQKGAVGDE